jgi:hypothetical protein
MVMVSTAASAANVIKQFHEAAKNSLETLTLSRQHAINDLPEV